MEQSIMKQRLLESVIFYVMAVKKEEKWNLNEVIKIIKCSKKRFEKELFVIHQDHPARVSYKELSNLKDEDYEEIVKELIKNIKDYTKNQSNKFLGFINCKEVEEYSKRIVNKLEPYKSIEELENAKDAESMYELGLRYYNGELVQQNKEKAEEYLQKAADLGIIKAKYYIGKINERNLEICRNCFKEVVDNLEPTEAEYQESKYLMGLMYFTVEKNYEAGIRIFQGLSEKYNHLMSKVFLGMLSFYEEQYEKEEAYEYFREIFMHEPDKVEYLFGLMEYYGDCIEKSYRNAYNRLEKLDSLKEKTCHITEQVFFNKNTTIQNEEFVKEMKKCLIKSILYYYISLRKENSSIKIEEIQNMLEEDYENLKNKIYQRPRVEPPRIYFRRIETLTSEEYISIVKQLKDNIVEFVNKEKVEEIDLREEDNINKYVEKILG